ncbi:MAG TPA: FecR family protein [Bdellovibrionales bacterium]|nr:FecR family protein [Bdellovibrionales bacterium]
MVSALRNSAAGAIFVLWALILPVFAANASDCECAVIECGTCKDQVNIEFYTEKCAGGKKVKSCKRPICADKDPLPESCQASAKPVPAADEPKAAKPKAPKRMAGTVMVAVGGCAITRPEGDVAPAKVGAKVFEGDIIETTNNGKVVLKLMNDNTVNVAPSSRALIQLHETNDSTHKTLINLMYGTIRSAVKKAPGNAKNDFRVKTPSAVAGVRGTDFVTSYVEKVGITKVETLHGLVELRSPSGKHSVDVPAGRYASYVVPSGSSDIGDDDISKFVERGYMTEAQPLSGEDLARLDIETGFHKEKPAEERTVATKDTNICAGPSAKLNQCAWSCVNNPAGHGSCRTDLPQVKCVRKRCNANGEWAEETRLPSNASERCDGQKVVVDNCDY